MLKKLLSFWILAGGIYSVSLAQDTLLVEDAIKTAMENNFSIVLAKNNLEVSRINNTWAGVLPTVGVSATQTNNITNSKLTPFIGPVREGTNLHSNNLNASAMLNWTIFDGFNMFVTKEKLEEFERSGETRMRMAMEDLVSATIVSYYNIVLQQEMLRVLEEALKISQQRRSLAQSRYMVGAGSQLTVLQAQADLNADSSALINQQLAYANAKSDLNRLMGRDVTTAFHVSSAMTMNETLQYENLQEKIKSQNTDLLLARQNERVADLTVDQARSARYPRLSLFAGFNYNSSAAAIGFAKYSRNYGPTYGGTVSWNIFGGGSTSRAIQSSRIERLSQEGFRKDLELDISNQVYKSYNQYKMNISLVEIERKNLTITERNVAIALEKYKAGALTDLELREAQSTFMDASARLMLARYNAKQSEVELMRLSGELK